MYQYIYHMCTTCVCVYHMWTTCVHCTHCGEIIHTLSFLPFQLEESTNTMCQPSCAGSVLISKFAIIIISNFCSKPSHKDSTTHSWRQIWFCHSFASHEWTCQVCMLTCVTYVTLVLDNHWSAVIWAICEKQEHIWKITRRMKDAGYLRNWKKSMQIQNLKNDKKTTLCVVLSVPFATMAPKRTHVKWAHPTTQHGSIRTQPRKLVYRYNSCMSLYIIIIAHAHAHRTITTPGWWS